MANGEFKQICFKHIRRGSQHEKMWAKQQAIKEDIASVLVAEGIREIPTRDLL